MFKTPGHYLVAIFTGILSTFITAAMTGCSSSSGTAPAPLQTATLSGDVKNVPLSSGVPAQIVFRNTAPAGFDWTKTGDYTLDLAETLGNVTLSASPVADGGSKLETLWMLAKIVVKDAFAAESTEVVAHLSFSGDPFVCYSPVELGPYTIMGAVGESLSSTTSSVEFHRNAVDIINAGSFDVCLVATSPVDAYLTVGEVAVDYEPCAAATVEIAGPWSGTYTCDNNGDGEPDEGGPISMDFSVNPDGSISYVDDGGAEYTGHLCGSRYRFSGGKSGLYRESGTLVIEGDDARKTSRWRSVSDVTLGGVCEDILERS